MSSRKLNFDNEMRNQLSDDKQRMFREALESLKRKPVSAENSKPEEKKTTTSPELVLVKKSDSGSWSLYKREDRYFFIREGKETPEFLRTPSSKVVTTGYLPLAHRILADLDTYGPDVRSSESIIPWHFTMVENFSVMKHEDLEKLLYDSFLARDDWTYKFNQSDSDWVRIFGSQEIRIKTIQEWLKKCTHMQMTAACCIGNAYRSLNLSYVMAAIMENYDRSEQTTVMQTIAKKVSPLLYSVDEIVKDFDTFQLYYGIHLKEKGKIVNNLSILNKDLKSPQQFYKQCHEEFHLIAQDYGFAPKGGVIIPELMQVGMRIVLSFLQDQELIDAYGDDPTQHYYAIVGLSIQAGIVLGYKWHFDFDGLKEEYIESIIDDGPAEVAGELMLKDCHKDIVAANEYYSSIFTRWLVLHEPYWKLDDPREYTFNATFAAFQVGVSTILGVYGF